MTTARPMAPLPAARALDPAPRATTLIAASAHHSVRARAGRFWTWLLATTAARAPRLIPVIGPFFRWFAWNCSPYTRSSTIANARRILGPAATDADCTRLARRTLASFFTFITEIGRNRRRTIQQILANVQSIEGLEHYKAARALKRGAILAAAHLGPFESAVAGLREHEPKVHVVFRRDSKNNAFESLRRALHNQLGLIEAPVDVDPGTLGPWLGLRDALARDEVVLLQADRCMPGQRGNPVPFLHGHLELPPGPIKLAIATGSPLIPVFSCWENSRVRITMEEPIDATDPWPRTGGTHPALLALARTIEKHVQQHPEQWLMFDPAFCEDQESR